MKDLTNGIDSKINFIRIILNQKSAQGVAQSQTPSSPTILFTMATKNRDLHICVNKGSQCKASADVGGKSIKKKAKSKKQYKIKSDCFR